MKALFNLSFLGLILALNTSCEKSFLAEDQAATPLELYDALADDFEEHYSGFLPGETDWSVLRNQYRQELNSESSEEALWQTFTALLDELNDEHVKLYREGELFVSGAEAGERAFSEFDLQVIAENYLEDLAAPSDYLLSGRIKNSQIGYCFVAALLDPNPLLMEESLAAMDAQNLDALIIDLRNSIGGYDGLAMEYAAPFSDGIKTIYRARYKDGPGANDFSAAHTYKSKEKSDQAFEKPVILLTDAATASEAEILSLHLRQFPQVIHLGDTTAGALSVVGPARFLANGWRYEYSIQRVTNPDGSSFEKLGIPPRHYHQNSREDVQNGQDKVLEASLRLLEEEFNIH